MLGRRVTHQQHPGIARFWGCFQMDKKTGTWKTRLLSWVSRNKILLSFGRVRTSFPSRPTTIQSPDTFMSRCNYTNNKASLGNTWHQIQPSPEQKVQPCASPLGHFSRQYIRMEAPGDCNLRIRVCNARRDVAELSLLKKELHISDERVYGLSAN